MNGTYRFTLTISSPIQSRQSNTSILVNIINDPTFNIPQISISTTNTIWNPSESLRFYTEITPTTTTSIDTTLLNYQWKETQHNFSLILDQTTLTLNQSRSLVLKSFVLMGLTTYNFVVTVQDPINNWQVTAGYTFTTIDQPSNGICTVSPLTGISLETIFHLNCTGWQSTSPLRYQFRINYNNLTYSWLTSILTINAIDINLPEGKNGIQIEALIITSDNVISIYPNFPLVFVTNANLSACAMDAQLLFDRVQQAIALGKDDQAILLLQNIISNLISNSTNPVCSQNIPNLLNSFYLILNSIIQHPYLSDSVAEQLTNVLVDLLTKTTTTVTDSVTIQLILNMTTTLIQEVGTHPDIAIQILTILNQLLEQINDNCPILNSIIQLISYLTRVMLYTLLPDENSPITGSYIYSQLNGTSLRINPQDPISIDTLNLTIPSSLLTDNTTSSNFFDLSILRYNQKFALQCRTTPTQTPAGPIQDVTISNNSNIVNVSGSNNNGYIIFYLPINQSMYYETLNNQPKCTNNNNLNEEDEQIAQCTWWNGSGWSNQGCQAVGKPFFVDAGHEASLLSPGSNSNNSELVIKCQCTHLTEFTVLLLIAKDCPLSQIDKISYLIFAIIYAFLALIAGIQFLRLIYGQTRNHSVIVQHCLIALVGAFRSATNFLFAGYGNVSLWVLGFITALPYMTVFWIYTLMVFQWAAIYHLALKSGHSSAFRKVQPLFIISNIFVIVVVILIFLSIINPGTRNLALTGAIILASIMIICGTSFLIYGTLLGLQMRETSQSFHGGTQEKGQTSPHASPSRHTATSSKLEVSKGGEGDEDFEMDMQSSFTERFLRCLCCAYGTSAPKKRNSSRLWIKMLTASITVAICFIMESIMQVVSVIQLESWGGMNIVDTIYTSVFYIFDLIALFTILFIFRRMVRKEVAKQLTKSFPHTTTQNVGGGGGGARGSTRRSGAPGTDVDRSKLSEKHDAIDQPELEMSSMLHSNSQQPFHTTATTLPHSNSEIQTPLTNSGSGLGNTSNSDGTSSATNTFILEQTE